MNFTSSKSPFLTGSWLAALAGAGGGLLSFFVGEIVGSSTFNTKNATSMLELLIDSAIWSGSLGLTIGAAILIYDNVQSLRGQWHRDLLGALPLFFGLSFLGGVAGQFFYSIVQNSLSRGIGWGLIGASVGMGIGFLRRDMAQAGRGAMGGAVGGFLGGFIFNGLTLISSAGDGSLSRLVGQILMGSLIALLMRVVQDALKSAWLLGISTGPYEGKEYPLNTARVSVGRDDSNAIALYREKEMPAQLGALVFQNGEWFWQGAPVAINGAPQTNATLIPGDILQLGTTRFRFQNRSVKNPSPSHNYPAAYNAQQNDLPPIDSSPQPYSPARPYAPPPPTVVVRPSTTSVVPSYALMTLTGQLMRLPDLTTPAQIGRTAVNDVILADAGVSSTHARLELSGNALHISDLGSTNGTFVNGVRLVPHTTQVLRNGDRVRFGSLETTLRSA